MILAISGLCLLLTAQVPSYEIPLAQQLRLSLSTDKNVYYPREGMEVRLTVSNDQAAPVRGSFMVNPDGPKVELYYRLGSSPFVKWEFPVRKAGYAEPIRTLRQHEEVAEEALVLFDPGHHQFVLDKPGRYELKAVYRDAPQNPNSLLESNVVGFEVVPIPAGERDAMDAYSAELAFSTQMSVRYSFMPQDAIRKAVDFIDRFPSGPYSEHVRNGLMMGLRNRVIRKQATKEERDLYEKLYERFQAEKAQAPNP